MTTTRDHKLTSRQIDIVRFIAEEGPVAGPAPGSQTDGEFLSAVDRNAIIESGYLLVTERDFSDGTRVTHADGRSITEDEAPFLLTHEYAISQAGVAVLQAEGIP